MNRSDPSIVVRIDRVCPNRPLLGESASPFIDEGDGLTNERESEVECVS